jgi:hypothetical protein
MAARFSQLRELARQFSAGQVGRDDYRRDRSAMLEQIGNGKLAIAYREITPPKPASPPTVLIDVGDDEPGTNRLPIIVGALVLVAGLAGGGWWYINQQTAAPAELVDVAPKAEGVAVIEDFLMANDWSSAGIAEFERRWSELDAAHQAEGRNDPAFGRLEAGLRSRIEDQLSVMSLDQTGQAQAEATRLRDFGTRLGVPVP